MSYMKCDVRAEVDSGDASAWPEVTYPQQEGVEGVAEGVIDGGVVVSLVEVF